MPNVIFMLKHDGTYSTFNYDKDEDAEQLARDLLTWDCYLRAFIPTAYKSIGKERQ